MEWAFFEHYCNLFCDVSSQISTIETTVISWEQKSRTSLTSNIFYKMSDKGLDHKDFVRYYKIWLPGESIEKPAVNWKFRFDLEPAYIRGYSWDSGSLVGQLSSLYGVLYFLSEVTKDSILLIQETQNGIPASLVINPAIFLLNSNEMFTLDLNHYSYIINRFFSVCFHH